MNLRNFLLIATIFILNTSCATIFLGGTQRVMIDSEPPGAEIYVNDESTNKVTPARIWIRRKQPRNNARKREVRYELRKDEYQPARIRDQAGTNYFLGFLSWSAYLVPGMIDALAGTNNTYQRRHFVDLTPMAQPSAPQPIVEQQVVQEIVYVEVESGRVRYSFERNSSIDNNIPTRSAPNRHRFALIIGNEDYSSQQVELTSEIDVHFARNDASAFKDYAMKVLGVPERNISFLLDATTGQMNQAISRMEAIIRNSNGNAEVFVYYAGHGLPDEVTREAYLMPVDVSGSNATNGINLNRMYQRLTSHPSKHVTVFIDACFSGGAREQGLLAARGVRVRPQENMLGGNLVVFAASSGDQSALPYNREQHGFFTYFLLEKFQQHEGPLTYGELANYLRDVLPLESVLINERDQTPQVNVSPTMGNDWENLLFFK